jgi:hypothetical protein
MAEYKEKLERRAQRKARGEKVLGPEPKPPSESPKASDQYNFTDPDSRIMKAGNGQHFEQSYNAQVAVEVNSLLIMGERVSQAPNDKQELVPTVQATAPAVGSVAAVLTDSGFYSEAAVKQIEQTDAGAPTGTTVYAAVEKTDHHRSVADLEQRPEPPAPDAGASPTEVMAHRLKTASGKALYKLRQQTVEPVFGVIKSVSLEWTLVCLAYNLRRLHWSGAAMKLAAAG